MVSDSHYNSLSLLSSERVCSEAYYFCSDFHHTVFAVYTFVLMMLLRYVYITLLLDIMTQFYTSIIMQLCIIRPNYFIFGIRIVSTICSLHPVWCLHTPVGVYKHL